MTRHEKEIFCQLMACLLSPPDQELVNLLRQGGLYSFLQNQIQVLGGDRRILNGFLRGSDPGALLKDLGEAHGRLFSDVDGERISLVESFYKPWTQDSTCPLPFASAKGLLMGDSALHLLSIFEEIGMELSDEWKSRPDHLVIELEFLSYLYRRGTDHEVKQFIEDHLDWIPLLKERVKRSPSHHLYVSVLEVLDLFLEEEKRRLE
jgi:putative dimethyl sulfoxide reductase chaperone